MQKETTETYDKEADQSKKDPFSFLIYWSEEDKSFLGSIPSWSDHPLCHGATRQDVLDNLLLVEKHILSLPNPTT